MPNSVTPCYNNSGPDQKGKVCQNTKCKFENVQNITPRNRKSE